MIKTIVRAIVFSLLFSGLSMAVLLQLPPVAGVAWSLSLGAAFLWWHLRSNDPSAARRALIRLRPPKGRYAEMVLAGASTLAFAGSAAALVDLVAREAVSVDAEPWTSIVTYQESAGGLIAMMCLAGLVIPVVEEFCFRGYAQGALEQRYSPATAVAVSAVLFSAAHIGVPHWSILLVSLTLGLGMGAALHRFDSIWVGVGIHGTWNIAMSVTSLVSPDPFSTFGTWEPRVLMPLMFSLLAAGLVGWWAVFQRGPTMLTGSTRNEVVP
jgi:membrane protease YdiL (CAAX protease family)